MSKEHEFYSALQTLERAYPTGITTMGKCCAKGCPMDARGSGFCPSHAEQKLADIIGNKEIAIQLHEAVLHKREFIIQALDHMGL